MKNLTKILEKKLKNTIIYNTYYNIKKHMNLFKKYNNIKNLYDDVLDITHQDNLKIKDQLYICCHQILKGCFAYRRINK